MPKHPFTRRSLALAASIVLAACGPGGDSPTADTTDIDLGVDAEGQPTNASGCVVADSVGDGEWRCRVGRRLVVAVRPVYSPRDSTGRRTLQALVLRHEGTLAPRRDTLAFPDGEFMTEVEPYDVSTADLDGDGWADLRLRHHYGIAANEGHYVWRWMPGARRFAWDDLLSGETNVSADGVGCVRTFGSIGHGGQDQVENRYCLTGGEWIEVERREQRWDEERGGPWETFYERRGDSLVVVREGKADQ